MLKGSIAETEYSVSLLIKVNCKSSMVAAERIKGAKPRSAKHVILSPSPRRLRRRLRRRPRLLFVRNNWVNTIGFILNSLRLNLYGIESERN